MKDYGTAIHEFQGEYRWLSNFWPAPVLLGTLLYPTVEHAYQAAKTHDDTSRSIIRMAPTPGRAKWLGKHMTNLRPDWNAVRVGVMRELIWQKFVDHELATKLLATLPHKLVEGNTWGDTFWGVCKGVGENQLGKLLMERRNSLVLAGRAREHMTNIPDGHTPWPETKPCICADPENCTIPVRGCKAHSVDEEQWERKTQHAPVRPA